MKTAPASGGNAGSNDDTNQVAGVKRKAPMPGPGLAAPHPSVACTPGEPSHLPGGLNVVQQADSRSVTPLSGVLTNHHAQHQGQNSSNLFEQLETAALNGQQEEGSVDLGSGPSTGETLSSLLKANNDLKTRVSELELVNDLFQGRVKELEKGERELREKLQMYETGDAASATDIDGGVVTTQEGEAQDAVLRDASHDNVNNGDPSKRRKTAD